MLETLVGAKPILMTKGKGTTKDDIAAIHPSSAAKVTIKSKRINGKKPKVYQFAQLSNEDEKIAEVGKNSWAAQLDSEKLKW